MHIRHNEVYVWTGEQSNTRVHSPVKPVFTRPRGENNMLQRISRGEMKNYDNKHQGFSIQQGACSKLCEPRLSFHSSLLTDIICYFNVFQLFFQYQINLQQFFYNFTHQFKQDFRHVRELYSLIEGSTVGLVGILCQ